MGAECSSNGSNNDLIAAGDVQVGEASEDGTGTVVEASSTCVRRSPDEQAILDAEGEIDLVLGRVDQRAQDSIGGTEKLADRESLAVQDTVDQVEGRRIVAHSCTESWCSGSRNRDVNQGDGRCSGLNSDLTAVKLIVSLGHRGGSGSRCAVTQEEELFKGKVGDHSAWETLANCEWWGVGTRAGGRRDGVAGRGDLAREDRCCGRNEAGGRGVRDKDRLKNDDGGGDRRADRSAWSHQEEIPLVEFSLNEGVGPSGDTGGKRRGGEHVEPHDGRVAGC